MGYIPDGMAQRQARWEWVNTHLYRHLVQSRHHPELSPYLRDLLHIQEEQAALLARLSGDPSTANPLPVEVHHGLIPLLDELHDREYQLLQEYLAYQTYFLHDHPEARETAARLAGLQRHQVNLLTDLRSTFRALHGEAGHHGDDHHGDGENAGHGDGAGSYRLEQGYRLEQVVSGLTYATGVTFDEAGQIYVVEAGFAYGTEPGPGRILRVRQDGSTEEVAGSFPGPVTGAVWHRGALYVAAGARGRDAGLGGQIVRVTPGGDRAVIVSGLPTGGDHFTGTLLFGPDGKLYFTVGTTTNSAVVGTDNLPWLRYYAGLHDRPARPVTLTGANFITPNPLTGQEHDTAVTGPYKPFGQPCRPGETVPAALPANGTILRCNPDGSGLETVADGFRNPFGLRFGPDGNLYASDNGADVRGSRPVRHDWDNFWQVTGGGWHGWPELYSGLPVTLPHFRPPEGRAPDFVLAAHPPLASQPLVRFKHHVSANKFDFSLSEGFGHVGQVFLAQTGGMGWGHHEAPLGFKVVRFHPLTGQIRDFLINPHGDKRYPGPIRPVEAKFSPDGSALWVVDFGLLGRVDQGLNPQPKTGALWRVVRA